MANRQLRTGDLRPDLLAGRGHLVEELAQRRNIVSCPATEIIRRRAVDRGAAIVGKLIDDSSLLGNC
jgi:hypothetical protein